MVPSGSTTRLAIVGASVRAAAQSALRAGFNVVGADLFADADLDGVCPITKIADYPEGLADWLAAQDVDAWIYTGALENYPDLVDRMAAIAPLWGVSGEALGRCRDPLWLQHLLATEGVAFPLTLPADVPPPGEGAWLAKTYRHAAGAGVWRYGEHPAGKSVYAQRVAQGASFAAVYAVSQNGATLLGVTEQLVEGYAYRGSLGPVEVDARLADQLARIGALLGTAVELRGLVGVDFLLSGGDAIVVEINPRFTASIEVLERASGASAIGAHAACIASPSPPKWPAPRASIVGKRIVFASRRIDVDQRLGEELAALHQQGQLADVPRVGTVIEAGEPFATVLASGASSEETLRALVALAAGLLARCAARG